MGYRLPVLFFRLQTYEKNIIPGNVSLLII